MTENPSITPPATDAPACRRFRRSNRGMIAGVCGGFADYFGVDATLIRVALVAATILGFGAGIVAYLAAWVLAPQE